MTDKLDTKVGRLISARVRVLYIPEECYLTREDFEQTAWLAVIRAKSTNLTYLTRVIDGALDRAMTEATPLHLSDKGVKELQTYRRKCRQAPATQEAKRALIKPRLLRQATEPALDMWEWQESTDWRAGWGEEGDGSYALDRHVTDGKDDGARPRKAGANFPPDRVFDAVVRRLEQEVLDLVWLLEPEEQRILILRACGWQLCEFGDRAVVRKIEHDALAKLRDLSVRHPSTYT